MDVFRSFSKEELSIKASRRAEAGGWRQFGGLAGEWQLLGFPVSSSENAPRHRIELLHQLQVSGFRGGDERRIESTIGTDRARLVFARKIPGKPAHKALGLVGVGEKNADDIRNGDRIMIGMPAVEVGDHGNGRVANLRLPR